MLNESNDKMEATNGIQSLFSYYDIVKTVGSDNLEFLTKMYSRVPSEYRVELLHKYACSPKDKNCFSFLLEKIKDKLSESETTQVFTYVMQSNSVNHLDNCSILENLPIFKKINIAVAGVNNMSLEAVDKFLKLVPASVASSVLSHAVFMSTSNKKYETMAETIFPYANKEDLPHVVTEAFERFVENYGPLSSSDVSNIPLQEFVVNLESSNFKKVYKKIHRLVKENNLEMIAVRHSKEKMLTIVAEIVEEKGVEVSAPRRKI